MSFAEIFTKNDLRWLFPWEEEMVQIFIILHLNSFIHRKLVLLTENKINTTLCINGTEASMHQ